LPEVFVYLSLVKKLLFPKTFGRGVVRKKNNINFRKNDILMEKKSNLKCGDF